MNTILNVLIISLQFSVLFENFSLLFIFSSCFKADLKKREIFMSKSDSFAISNLQSSGHIIFPQLRVTKKHIIKKTPVLI
jgi:hypothetical protein